MARPNFDETLHLFGGGAPVAGGPVPPGDKLRWIRVWLIQNGPGPAKAAASYGASPYGVTFGPGKWEINTYLAHASDPFIPGRPAQATAIALVEHGNTKEVDWWSEAVAIAP